MKTIARSADRAITFFLALLLALNAFLFLKHRVIPLFISALVLNTAACGWYLWGAFSARKTTVRPAVQAMLLVLLLLFDSLMFIAVYTRYQQTKHPVVTLNAPAPLVPWVAFDGTKHTLAECSGHVVVLHFWATWCVPCRQEFPKLIAFARVHPDITFVAFDANDDREKADRFLANAGAAAKAKPGNVLFAWDEDGKIAYDTFRALGFPSSIVVDDRGWMRRKYAGPVEWQDNEVSTYLQSLNHP